MFFGPISAVFLWHRRLCMTEKRSRERNQRKRRGEAEGSRKKVLTWHPNSASVRREARRETANSVHFVLLPPPTSPSLSPSRQPLPMACKQQTIPMRSAKRVFETRALPLAASPPCGPHRFPTSPRFLCLALALLLLLSSCQASMPSADDLVIHYQLEEASGKLHRARRGASLNAEDGEFKNFGGSSRFGHCDFPGRSLSIQCAPLALSSVDFRLLFPSPSSCPSSASPADVGWPRPDASRPPLTIALLLLTS